MIGITEEIETTIVEEAMTDININADNTILVLEVKATKDEIDFVVYWSVFKIR